MTETASLCNPEPTEGASANAKSASPACNTAKSGGPTNIEEAFRDLWASNSIFASVAFDDMVKSITTRTVWAGSVWSHTIEIEYKPEAPVDHVTFTAAALDLVNTVYNNVAYCGCSVTLSITDEVQSSYNTEVSPLGKFGKSGKCKHAFTPPKGKKGKKSTMNNLGE